MELEDLKNKYAEFEKKYALPDFEEINKEFEIEKIERESALFMKIVRKTMMDKVVNSIGFLDMLLNPVNAPRIYMPFVKVMNGEDKKIIDGMYEIFSELSLSCLVLELDYDEQKEADMIKRILKDWKSAKVDFVKLMNRVYRPGKDINKRERSYFG